MEKCIKCGMRLEVQLRDMGVFTKCPRDCYRGFQSTESFLGQQIDKIGKILNMSAVK